MLTDLILFLEAFHLRKDDDVRFIVFECIKKLLCVSDEKNTEELLKKIMDQ